MSNSSTGYSDLVIQTFRTGAIRTAMIIDDKFPTYAEVVSLTKEQLETFQTETARKVYETLRNVGIHCDIENVPNKLTSERFEHVRKSDLIILDYHLRGNDDASDAIQLLARLADSEHFNLAVVYTAAKELTHVWLQIAARLRGEWKNPGDLIGIDTPSHQRFEQLLKENKLSEPTEKSLAEYILQEKATDPTHAKELKEEGIAKEEIGKLVAALFHGQVKKGYADDKLNDLLFGKRRNLRGRFGEPYWILCGNVFIVLTTKRAPESTLLSNEDPEGILACLDAGLKDWNPNLIQLLISEFHNVIERDSIPIEHRILHDTETQAGWICLFLQEHLAVGTKEASAEIIQELVRRLFTTVERRVVSHPGLLNFIGQAFDQTFTRKLGSAKTGEQLVALAVEAGNFSDLGSKPGTQVLHALNCFLCSDDFSDRNITTGTIFCDDEAKEWWVCVWPQCDMVPREPKGELQWRQALRPGMPMFALRLQEVTLGASLERAEDGRHVFLKVGSKRLCLRAFDEMTHQPNPYMFILEDNIVGTDSTFRAYFLQNDANGKPVTNLKQFRAVAQLRDAYANRLLQQTGHHTSRIGVDYVNFIAEDTYAEKQTKKAERAKALSGAATKKTNECKSIDGNTLQGVPQATAASGSGKILREEPLLEAEKKDSGVTPATPPSDVRADLGAQIPPAGSTG